MLTLPNLEQWRERLTLAAARITCVDVNGRSPASLTGLAFARPVCQRCVAVSHLLPFVRRVSSPEMLILCTRLREGLQILPCCPAIR